MPEGYFRDTILINGILYVLGNGFIRLMQMLVVPLVFCSLVCGAMAIGDTKTLGTVGVKTILFYLCTTALAICVALGIASPINPGVGLNIALPEDATEVATTQVDFAETLLNIIPKNIFTSLSAGDMLPIIFFALFVGILLAAMGNRVSTVANFFSQFNDIMMEMTIAVMKAAPCRCLLPDCEDLRRHRLRRFCAYAEIYGKCHSGAGSTVFRGISGHAVCVHPLESF